MSPLDAASGARLGRRRAARAVAGCHTAGPQAVRTARIDYDEAMTAAYNEQLLLNLVRLRYRDTPHFLEVSSLVTEHVLGASASASALLGAGAADVGVSLGGTYEESPKVVYAPLAGEQFVTRMLTPIQVETLYLLMRSGWSVERVLRCCVREMSGLINAPSADGPTPTRRHASTSSPPSPTHCAISRSSTGCASTWWSPVEAATATDGPETDSCSSSPTRPTPRRWTTSSATLRRQAGERAG